jgi:hypothetical protein
MSAGLHVYYDTRLAPITFDFGSYLVIADAYRQKLGLEQMSIHLIRSAFRNKTLREQDYSDETKEWRFNHILIPLTSLLPSIKSVEWTKNGPTSIELPSFPATYPPRNKDELKFSIPYLSNELLKYKDKNIELRPYTAKNVAINLIKTFVDTEHKNVITISLRTSNQQQERNSNLAEWYKIYLWLIDNGYEVYIIPDFEDVMGNKNYTIYDWKILIPAVFDLNLRMATYSIANLNLGVLNGVLVPLFHSKYPYLIFKPNIETIHQTTKKWLNEIFGISENENFWWAGKSQYLSWLKDDDSSHMIEEIKKILK